MQQLASAFSLVPQNVYLSTRSRTAPAEEVRKVNLVTGCSTGEKRKLKLLMAMAHSKDLELLST